MAEFEHKVVGYHGCNRVQAKELVERSFEPSRSKVGWLGTGLYFWEGDEVRAWEWARRRAPRTQHGVSSKGEQPAVVRAQLLLSEPASTLDLVTDDGRAEYARFIREFEAHYPGMMTAHAAGDAGATPSDTPADALWIDHWCALLERANAPVSGVRAIVLRGYHGAPRRKPWVQLVGEAEVEGGPDGAKLAWSRVVTNVYVVIAGRRREALAGRPARVEPVEVA
jgi:hypothetical protein